MSKKRDVKKNSPKNVSQAVTMADVAKAVGVSRQSVGLVFNGKPGVGTETEVKIRKAAREIGYRPNRAAQSLRQDSTNYVGVVFHPNEATMGELLPALHNEAQKYGFEILLSAISEEHNEIQAIDSLLGHRCLGLIIIGSQLSVTRLQKLAREIPLVSLGRRLTGVRCGIVTSDGEAGVEAATRHLIDIGHTDIAYILGKDMTEGPYRLAGYVKAMERARLKVDVVTIYGDYAMRGGASAADEFMHRKKLPTAIVCNNDESAVGLWHRFAQHGIKVPEDVSLVGYDDSLAHFSYLDMTSVTQDPKELAVAAVKDVAGRISGEQYLAKTYLTSANVVVRTSTSQPVHLLNSRSNS